MKANKKAFRIIAVGLLINSGTLLLHQFIQFPDILFGILQGAGIGIMIGGLIKMRKEKKMC